MEGLDPGLSAELGRFGTNNGPIEFAVKTKNTIQVKILRNGSLVLYVVITVRVAQFVLYHDYVGLLADSASQ